MTTREDVLRRFAWLCAMGDVGPWVLRDKANEALAEADALPSDAERWQHVRDLLVEWNATGDNYSAWRRLRDIVTGAAL